MNIFNYIDFNEHEENIMRNWICANNKTGGCQDLYHFLRFWASNKANLFHAFGNKLILEKEVNYKMGEEELADIIHDEIWSRESGTFLRHFNDLILRILRNAYQDATDPIYNNITLRWALSDLMDSSNFAANSIQTDEGYFPAKYLTCKNNIPITKGAKIVKFIGKVINNLNIDYINSVFGSANFVGYNWKYGYEQFRLVHSMVLNQKELKGTLCLSIHPMDYMTMSDNDCDWESCMSWSENGDYRMGTIEMMTSPYVVVAYLKASHDYYIGKNYYWNNKKWRQLYIMDQYMLVGNRQYPYNNSSLEDTCLNWLRELGIKAGYFQSLEETRSIIVNDETNKFGGQDVFVNMKTGYMYNDMYGERHGYVSSVIPSNYYLFFSGPAVCTDCGDEIELNFQDAYEITCPRCRGAWQCEHCGSWHSEMDYSYEINGETVCEYCYENYTECDACGEKEYEERLYCIEISTNTECHNRFNGRYIFNICENCFENFEQIFGTKLINSSFRYSTSKSVNIEEVNEIGFKKIMNSLNCLSTEREKLITDLHNAFDIEDRKKILEDYYGVPVNQTPNWY